MKENVEPTKKTDVELAEDRPVYTPSTDIFESKDAILVRCDMPGVDDQSLDVTLEDDVLTITGRQHTDDAAGYDSLSAEYGTGIFRRAFTIAQDINHDRIQARIKQGVLELELPKAERAKPRRISVQT